MRKRSGIVKGLLALVVAMGLLWIGGTRELSAHGKGLVKKGGGPAVVELGPHGGAVIDIGDGHFELVRDPDGALSLYRLDSELTAIPAEDVDAAELYVLGPAGPPTRFVMTAVKGVDEKTPFHFRAAPKVAARGGYLAIVAVGMGEVSRNLRFEVTGN